MNKFIGRKVKDVVTGFCGTATGFVTYLTGCSQVLVQPPVKEDGGMVDSIWFDETRIEFLDGAKLVLNSARLAGPDKQAPKR